MAIVDGKIHCSNCLHDLPLKDFTGKSVKRGYGACRSCEAARRKAAYAQDPEKKRAYMRDWYAKRKAADPVMHESKMREQYEKSQIFFNVKVRRTAALKRYGLSVEQYDDILASQGGCCAICKATENKNGRSLFVDHCHDTGRVRGILCYKCNTGLGSFADSPDLIQKALSYLT